MNHKSAVPSDNGFGEYLATVAERDIDFLLMEEFHASDEFVSWFCSNLGLNNVSFSGAWHSVSDTDGENDLVLLVKTGECRTGVLIENKVTAPEQYRQAERYQLRGIKLRDAGKFNDYVTVICAPQRYLDGLSSDNAYNYRIPYEALALWFAKQTGRREAWRRHVVEEAIEQNRRGYQMIPNLITTAFHCGYWNHLHNKHPEFVMAKPKNRGSHSTWIIFKGHTFPPGVHMNHKLEQQVMELGFAGHQIEEILAVKSDWPADIALIQKGQTAALAISVPLVDMKLGFEVQLSKIEQALQAARRLMPYASLLQKANAKKAVANAAQI